MKYLILGLAAVIAFPVLFVLVQRNKVEKWILVAGIFGFLIAGIGLMMQDTFELFSVLAVLFGLVFVFTVLLDKQIKRTKQRIVEVALDPATRDWQQRAAKEEMAAASQVEEEITFQPIEEDLERWTVADRQDVLIDGKEDAGRRPDGE